MAEISSNCSEIMTREVLCSRLLKLTRLVKIKNT